ncbi:MAG: hypothetical protein L6Q69_23395, partial [Zoogloea sp.]|nr:hypothetical protein [Zoogloea sp.]
MEASTRIVLVTGATMAKPDPETHLLVAALAKIGVEAVVAPWDSPEDWAAYPLVVVRTPWDYFRRLPEFLAWAARTSQLTAFVNPVSVIEWNSHKAYLRELAAKGIPTVPTLWLDQGAADGAARLAATGWGEVVVKPAVSIGAIGAMKAHAADPACIAHLAALLAEGDVLVQPFIESVAAQGEVSLIYFGGTFSHAIRKQPAAGDYRVQDMYGGTNHPYQPAADEVALATLALSATPAPTTYARVDMVRLPDGRPAVMELELIEPELFLGVDP